MLVPIVGALTRRSSAYWMVGRGGDHYAASVFFMVLPPQLFEPIARGGFGDWIGHSYLGLKGMVHPYYVMIAFFIILFRSGKPSIPRGSMSMRPAIAPQGQEASYGALSYIPSREASFSLP
ncbi:MAG: hypothetical protein WDN28_11880 [Chthoniobacter sp.]